MKNIINDPKILLFICFMFFVVATIDSVNRDAQSFDDLGRVGKVAVICFMGPFGLMIGRYLLIPIWNWIVKWFM